MFIETHKNELSSPSDLCGASQTLESRKLYHLLSPALAKWPLRRGIAARFCLQSTPHSKTLLCLTWVYLSGHVTPSMIIRGPLIIYLWDSPITAFCCPPSNSHRKRTWIPVVCWIVGGFWIFSSPNYYDNKHSLAAKKEVIFDGYIIQPASVLNHNLLPLLLHLILYEYVY